MTSTRLYDQARQKANHTRFNAAKLSVPDELHWYNNHTNWESLSRKEFRSIMVRMESITTEFYTDYKECMYPHRSAAIKKFWADEWGCEYLPESGKWLDLATHAFIESETEKKAKRDAKKEAKKEHKAKKVNQTAQYNDEEEELYAQAAQQQQQQQQQTYRSRFDADDEAYEKLYVLAKSVQAQKAHAEEQAQKAHAEEQAQTAQKALEKTYEYDDWYDAEEEAYAEAYAKARAQEEQKEQQQAQSYLDYTSEEEEEELSRRIACQPVLYLEELTDVQGDPDWRAYIYYDARIRRYVFKGTRRSLRATSKKTRYPEVKLCFRSSRELARYLRSSTDATMNLSMFAMTSATVKDATFAELCALPSRGNKTELFGYDDTRPCYSTFVDYLCMLRDVDATHSNFAAF